MLAGDLNLEEALVYEPTSVWEVSEVGQSCDAFCQSKKGTCDEDAMASALTSSEDFSNEISGSNVCKAPLFSGCGEYAATIDPVTQYCYYPDPTCAAQNRTASIVTCAVKSDTARICACKVSLSESAADSFRGAGILSILFVFPLLFAVNEKMAITLLLLMGLSYTSAHNWINSPSRSSAASSIQPCKPSYTGIPHAQVGPGQPFLVEWMNGHGSFAYFAIQHASNAHFLNSNTYALLDDYIKNAPAGSNVGLKPEFQKLRRKDVVQTDGNLKLVNKTNPIFIERPTEFAGQIGNLFFPADEGKPHYLYQYSPSFIANDVRVSYKSEKYPWLEAVYKFEISIIQAKQPDTTHVFNNNNNL
jgi:hypothetical protein